MRYYLIAGEASGDLHGSNLIKQIRIQDPDANIRCWGGDLMQAAGATLVKHYRDLAFMGFAEVVANLRTIISNLSFCKQDIQLFNPDVLVLIDYPGFNLRIAEWAHQKKIKVVYYISPQVWAWKENRVKKMKQHINKLLCILPFEQPYYAKKWNWKVEYVGHPLVEVIDKVIADNPPLIGPDGQPMRTEKPIVALLPGSRKQEILKKLPVMLEVCREFPDYHFVVAKAPGIDPSFYDHLLQSFQNVDYLSGQTHALLLRSRAALVTSGTATLETALFGVPEVVCYKGNPISYAIAKRVVKVKFISLVNLIMNKAVVKELIQKDMNKENLVQELGKILHNETYRQQMLNEYRQLKDLLIHEGQASANAAKSIYDCIKPSMPVQP